MECCNYYFQEITKINSKSAPIYRESHVICFATNQFGAIFWKWERDEPLLTVCVIAGSPGKGAPLADVTQDRGQNRLGPIKKNSPQKQLQKKSP